MVVDEPRRMGGSDEAPSPMGYLVTSLAGCTAVILERCAKDAKLEIGSLKVKSSIVYSPRGIAGQEGYQSNPSEARSEIWLDIDGDGRAGGGRSRRIISAGARSTTSSRPAAAPCAKSGA